MTQQRWRRFYEKMLPNLVGLVSKTIVRRNSHCYPGFRRDDNEWVHYVASHNTISASAAGTACTYRMRLLTVAAP